MDAQVHGVALRAARGEAILLQGGQLACGADVLKGLCCAELAATCQQGGSTRDQGAVT